MGFWVKDWLSMVWRKFRTEYKFDLIITNIFHWKGIERSHGEYI